MNSLAQETLRQADFRGLTTCWWEAGNPADPILLFLHGFPDDAGTWDGQVAHFRESFHVLCPYVRGARPSAEAERLARYGTESCALDSLQMLAQADPSGQKPVYVVGHDLGAVHAWHLASLLGPRLQRLILINGLGLGPMLMRWSKVRQHVRSWYIYGMQLPGVAETLLRVTPRRMLRLAHDLGRLPEEKRPEVDNPLDVAMQPLRQYRQFVREIPATARRRLPRLQAPVLLLWGSRDAFLLPPTAEEWEPFAADVTTRILPTGHWPHREAAGQVNRLLDNFMARSPRGGRA